VSHISPGVGTGLDTIEHVSRSASHQLADALRAIAPAVAAVTDQFLERHPDWRMCFGSRAVTHGVQDAQYPTGSGLGVGQGATFTVQLPLAGDR
jgi:hypothetical protein